MLTNNSDLIQQRMTDEPSQVHKRESLQYDPLHNINKTAIKWWKRCGKQSRKIANPSRKSPH